MGNERQRKGPKKSKHLGTTKRGGTGNFRLGNKGLNDQTTRMLRKAQVKYSNDDLSKQLKRANTRRDALLGYILSRLMSIRAMQEVEAHRINDRKNWFRGVYRGKDSLPDPTRWRQSSRAYERAAESLARGHIGRGAALIEQAIEEELAAYESVPDVVEDHFDEFGPGASESTLHQPRPAEMDDVSPTETCVATGMPSEIKRYAGQIRNHQSRAPLVGWRAKRPHNWWGPDEEEEEEAADEG